MGKYDKKWEALFEKKGVTFDTFNNGETIHISAKELNEIDGVDARLMASCNSREKQPPIFKKMNISLRPSKDPAYDYEIGRFECFIDIPKSTKQEFLRANLKSSQVIAKMSDITSEHRMLSSFMNSAINGIETPEFIFEGEANLIHGGRGRHNNIQYETDAMFETNESLNIIEAKIGNQESINIRQFEIAYSEHIQKTKRNSDFLGQKPKEIRCFVFLFEAPLLRVISVERQENGTWIANMKKEKLIIFEFPHFELCGIQRTKTFETNDPTPFPQANDFGKVLDMFLLFKNDNKPANITALQKHFDKISRRQVNYYFSSLVFLGLTKQNNNEICLTNEGEKIVSLDLNKTIQRIAEIVFSKAPFYITLHHGKKRGLISLRKTMVDLAPSTILRRMGTILSWIKAFKIYEISLCNPEIDIAKT